MMARKKKEVALTSTGFPADYPVFLESLKSRVQQAQTKAMLSVNRELIQLYWDIGRLKGSLPTIEQLEAELGPEETS